MRRTLLTLVPAAALALCLYVVDLPLFVIGPGPAREVLPLIDIDGARTYPAEGRMLLTTVSVGRINAYEALAAWIDPDLDVVPEQAIVPPGQTDREYERTSLSQMDESKIAAVAVALERLTEYPRDHGPGVVIQDVAPDTPADGSLFPGDLITAVNGRRLEDLAELTQAIRDAGTANTLSLSVRPLEGGEVRRVRIRPVQPPEESGPIIGVYPVANFPFEVTIDSGEIGGPSAGLMWALGVVDWLTPGDLTDGRTLAGTGDVDLDGRVEGIGGIGLKIAAAERAGAEAFLLPEGNLAEAGGADTEIELVPVSSVGEAIRYLEGRE